MYKVSQSKRIVIVAAHSTKGVIGRAGTLPWCVPSDLRRFKRITMGKDVIVGRKTFESIRRHNNEKVPGGRRFIVLTRSRILHNEDYTTAATFEEALRLANRSSEVLIAGGVSVYEEGLRVATRMHLSEISVDEPGDTYFPPWDQDQWHCNLTITTHMAREPKVVYRIWDRK